jgi:hypothetical protein
MKNQYFGDINDYHKYGLLRILIAQGGLKIGVCWMLTCDDAGNDGGNTTYLNKCALQRHDPDLFGTLARLLSVPGNRNIKCVEKLGILPGALFFPDHLSDNRTERNAYFEKMLQQFAKVDLIFFDPDNGLEVKSKRYGSKGSSKYLYWPEVKKAYTEAGHSVLIYQHFPRVKHNEFVLRKCQEIKEHLGVVQVHALISSSVIYFLAAQPLHTEHVARALEVIHDRWAYLPLSCS